VHKGALTADQAASVLMDAASALALARILESPRAANQQPAAAKALVALVDELHSVSARGRRGKLSLVRTMTEPS
jgi:hypothetical protein